MATTPESLHGLDALAALCRLADRQRLAHPTAGFVEAADLQWWWRLDQRDDPDNSIIWYDDDGPVAAIIVTVMRAPALEILCLDDTLVATVRSRAERLLDASPHPTFECGFDDDDADWTAWATGIGFETTDQQLVANWQDAPAAIELPPLPDGYRLTTRARTHDRPHHMIRRSGERVETLLHQTGLYRPEHDIFVVGPDGDAAAYGLFWANPVTGVGLVEPMRTEESHSGRGLAGIVLRAGMEALVAAGCRRLKVLCYAGNDAAERLYAGAGFEPVSVSTTLRWSR